MTPSHFPGFGDTDNQTHSKSTTGRHDDPQVVRERARYIAATTDLSDAEARTLAWREAGYSHSGIATQVESTEATVRKRLDRITARYGIEAILSKQPNEHGRTPLSPATPDEIAAFPEETCVEWRGLAEEYPEYAPEWVGTDRDPTTEEWKRASKRAERKREREQGQARGGDGE